MPPIRSLVSTYYTKLILTIILLSKIIPFYSRYNKKKLVDIIIVVPFSR